MRIEVNEDDIRQGEPENGDNCPIARAARRVTPLAVSVGTWTINIGGQSYKLPAEASRFVEAFDAGWKVEPIIFEITEEES